MDETENNVISIGQQDTTEFVAFGDESMIDNTIVYAFRIYKSCKSSCEQNDTDS